MALIPALCYKRYFDPDKGKKHKVEVHNTISTAGSLENRRARY